MQDGYEQDGPMDVYPHRMCAKHARHARRIGAGNESLGARWAIEVATKVLFEGATAEEVRELIKSRWML